ncbi:MAG: hypothetical protein IJQ53_02210 [Clostridia bacterium]|nr:hypothetical protein [Clostridia bacterium]
MKDLVKTICLIVGLVLLIICFASCKDDKAVSQPTGESSEKAPESSADVSETSMPEAKGKVMLSKVSEPGGSWTVYDYNKRGDVLTEEQSSGLIKYYTYDDTGRLERTDVKDGGGKVMASEKWEYDSEGRLFRYTQWSGVLSTTEYEYGGDGRITKAVITDGSDSREETYEYAEDGSYIVKGTLANGKSYENRYNPSGDKTAAYSDGVKVSEYTYDSDGRILRYEMFYESEVYEYTAYHYDENGVLTEVEISTEPGRIGFKRYEYGEFGCVKVTYVSQSGEERVLEEYEYDYYLIDND